jgi:hypothetical protein
VKRFGKVSLWFGITSTVWNVCATIICFAIGYHALALLSIFCCLTSAFGVGWILWKRALKREEIERSIQEAKDSGAYEVSEHLTSEVLADAYDATFGSEEKVG